MPLTSKGKKIMGAMMGEYGAKKGKKVFYASQNKGVIKGTHKGKVKNMPGMSMHPEVNCSQSMRNNKSMPMKGGY